MKVDLLTVGLPLRRMVTARVAGELADVRARRFRVLDFAGMAWARDERSLRPWGELAKAVSGR